MRSSLSCSLAMLTLCLAASSARAGYETAGFEDLSLNPANFNVMTTAAKNGGGQYVINPAGLTVPSTDPVSSTFQSGGATFSNAYTTAYGSWSGWAYSNVNDVADRGYVNGNVVNPVSAYDLPSGGKGADGSSNYLVGFTYSPYAPFGETQYDTYIDLAPGSHAVSIDVTNSTYAALVMKDGDAGFKTAPYGPGSFLKLTITGFTSAGATGASTGSVDFYLADYRSGLSNIVSQWTSVNLMSLGDARSLGFAMTSSDVGQFGINTPTLFAADNLVTFVAVPEPSSLALIGIGVIGMAVVRRRRSRA